MEQLCRYEDILETIGNTPLIKLQGLSNHFQIPVYAKLESFNPGHSTKDRIARYMIEKAEREGRIKPGGTIIEATSGNTGFSIAMISSVKGYKCVLTVKDKVSKDKIALLKTMGAEVIMCPKDVAADDPRSYYETAKRLSKEIPNSFYLNQNYDPGNSEAHYYSTGPEVWRQTQGRITHFVACTSTGGTISGTGKYLKEQRPDVKVIGVDANGSVLEHYHQTGEYDPNIPGSTQLEGVGKNIIPGNVDFDTIDQFIKVGDRESAINARTLVKQEGILVGYSSGAAIEGMKKLGPQLNANDFVVLLFPDHGSRYLAKIYNDQWMKSQGFVNGQHSESSLNGTHIKAK